jgi:flagellar biosynthesis GTPase FlhF
LDKRKERQEKNAQAMAERRSAESFENRTERQDKDAQANAASRSAESTEKKKERQEKNAQAMAASRSAQSPEKKKERQEKDTRAKTNKKKKLSKQQPIESVHSDSNADVPKISQFVETTESLKLAFEYLLKTKIGEDEQLPEYLSSPGIHYPLKGMCHQANVCVCCDRFITGTNEVKWISKETLIRNQFRLQDHELTVSLKNCYNVFDPDLQHCLLSPRARVNTRDEFTCCSQCSDSLRPHMRDKSPPKFAISNKWAI